MRKLIKSFFRRNGFDIIPYRPQDTDTFSDLSPVENKIIAAAKPFTMTSVSRMAALIHSVNYITKNGISGDMCECGVWRGGSMMVIAKTLLAQGDTSRSLYLYDTFEGMSPPTAEDQNRDGKTAESLLHLAPKGTGIWCHATLEDVRANLLSTGYPADKIHFIKGKVEDTIPATLPQRLSLLRLDTDWYASTRHELEHLFPLLVAKGVLIIDDYGDWQGARKAVDEYFQQKNGPVFLHRIDETGRAVVKI
jgi:O-methyltransferase